MTSDRFSALVLVDVPGFILDRLGNTWVRYARGVRLQLGWTGVTHPFVFCRRASQQQLVHWLDPLMFQIWGRAIPVPQVVTVHHLTEPEVAPMLARLDSADAIATSSQRWKAKLESLTARPVTVIPYTLDTQVYTPAPEPSELRARAGIGEQEFVLGYVGKASSDAFGRKGIDLLRRVLELANQTWRSLCVALVGPGWESLAASLRVQGIRVVQYEFGAADETAAVYPLMDALLVTSSEEGGPCTILEAMACGIPVITSDVGHVPEVVRDGETGLICRERTPEEYVRKIGVLRGSPELRNHIVAAARCFVERHRDDRAVIPHVNFSELYETAARTYSRRVPIDRMRRYARFGYTATRFGANRVIGTWRALRAAHNAGGQTC